MDAKRVRVLLEFLNRVESIINGGVTYFKPFPVTRTEYQALYLHNVQAGPVILDLFGPDDLVIVPNGEEDADLSQATADSEQLTRLTDAILEEVNQLDIEAWDKDYRPAFRISEANRNLLVRAGLDPSRVYGLDLYVNAGETELVPVGRGHVPDWVSGGIRPRATRNETHVRMKKLA